MAKKAGYSLSSLLLVISFCLVSFAVSAYIASSRVISGTELAIFRVVNNLPEYLRAFFWVITQYGSIWSLSVISLFLIFTKKYRLSVRLFSNGVVAFVFTAWMKTVFVRPRPSYILNNVNIRELAVGSGFPSGHAAVATVITLVLLPVVPKKFHIFMYLAVFMVAFSRVYLGVHAPLDVVGGILIGIIVVYASKIIKNKLKYVTKITHLKLSD